MSAPRQVLDQEKAAEEEFKAIYLDPETDQPAEKPADTAPEPKPEESNLPEGTDTPPEPATQEPTLEPEPKQPDEGNDVSEELRIEKERYNTLVHKYNAEVPRLSKELKELKKEIEFWRDKAMNTAPQPVQPKEEPKEEPTNPQDKLKYYEPKLVEEYGEEILSGVMTATDRRLDERLQAFEEQNRKMNEMVTRTESETFMGRLERTIPNFQQVNRDPGFIGWLQQSDGFSGLTKGDALNQAVDRKDSDTIAKIFSAWSNPTGSKQTARAAELERQVAPNKTAAPTTPKQGKTYTMTEYTQILNDIARGKYTEADAKKIENQLDQAYREGRIT